MVPGAFIVKNSRRCVNRRPLAVPSDTLRAYDSHHCDSIMRTSPFLHSPVACSAVSGVLRAKGFELGDFELDEDDVGSQDDLLSLVGSLLRVRCFSTGEERVYPTGAGSAWLGAFLMDLGGGHFSRAVRGTGKALT